MKIRKVIANQPFLGICREEWKRAKSIIRFSCKKPKIYWQKGMGQVHGQCNPVRNEIYINENYQQDNFLGTEYEEEFRKVLRHEFAHLVEVGHGKEFKIALERLGGIRYTSINLPPMSVQYAPAIRKKVEKPKVDIKTIRYQRAVKNLKKAQRRFKIAKTVLKRWENKVKYYSKMLQN
jgi:predicted SprT family Zn-dependent metalloprotease